MKLAHRHGNVSFCGYDDGRQSGAVMKNCPQAAWSVVLNATFKRDCLGMTADVSLSVAGTVKDTRCRHPLSSIIFIHRANHIR
jgi:hypothetical protein